MNRVVQAASSGDKSHISIFLLFEELEANTAGWQSQDLVLIYKTQIAAAETVPRMIRFQPLNLRAIAFWWK